MPLNIKDFHNFNLDKCLYCGQRTVYREGNFYSNSNYIYNFYDCLNCQETFLQEFYELIFTNDLGDPVKTYTSFGFSCQDIFVIFYTKNHYRFNLGNYIEQFYLFKRNNRDFDVGKPDWSKEYSINSSIFPLEFKKPELYEKLKIISVF